MSEMTDVLLKIKYRKGGELHDDDLLEDIDMYDAISDMGVNGIDYQSEKNLILRTNAMNYYPLSYEKENKLRDYLFEISREKGIEEIYIIFCEYSYALDVIRYGIIHIDVRNTQAKIDIKKEENYTKVFKEMMDKSYPDLKSKYGNFLDGLLEDEAEYRFEEKMDRIMGKYAMSEFKKFLKTVKFD